jgi:two-component system, NarL family, nitrate/nitrite response regulator NarL
VPVWRPGGWWVMSMPDLVIGDDHAVFLDALSTVLAQQGFDVTVARNAAETVDSVRRNKPDICLVDRHFADDDGVDAIGHVIAASPGTKVLVLSADPDTDGVLRALRAGASGYLHKTQGVSALRAAIDRVLRGEVVVSVPKASGANGAVTAGRSVQADHAKRLASYLTDRERECLGMIVEGLDTAAMVARLGVSRTTIRTHIQAVLTKLGVHSRLEAASFAVRYRLLDDERARVHQARAVLGHRTTTAVAATTGTPAALGGPQAAPHSSSYRRAGRGRRPATPRCAPRAAPGRSRYGCAGPGGGPPATPRCAPRAAPGGSRYGSRVREMAQARSSAS